MAVLEYKDKRYTARPQISAIMAEHGLSYEHWGVQASTIQDDKEVLGAYEQEIGRLKRTEGYVTADLMALRPTTPGLSAIGEKFAKEHHHSEDEVRFTVEGEGVFEIRSKDGEDLLKFTAEPGDLIRIPAYRRHLFYLTDKKEIRCIRLFQDPQGWEAIYD